ncbi:ATP-NAD kinase-like domain-containing protein [Phakopsora pachyrhizi]|nr:ATP-NAD kinase-like domain-containing protein [Phakopsora pachyrhizi]
MKSSDQNQSSTIRSQLVDQNQTIETESLKLRRIRITNISIQRNSDQQSSDTQISLVGSSIKIKQDAIQVIYYKHPSTPANSTKTSQSCNTNLGDCLRRQVSLIKRLSHKNHRDSNQAHDKLTNEDNIDDDGDDDQKVSILISYQNVLNCKILDVQKRSTTTEEDVQNNCIGNSNSTKNGDEDDFFDEVDKKFFRLIGLSSTDPNRGKIIIIEGLFNPGDELVEGEDPLRHPKGWIKVLMDRAYRDVPRSRKILVIVNPFGGSGKGQKIWKSTVEPILKLSTASVEVKFTSHSGHASEIGKELRIDKVDVVVCVSGDGVIHELINGIGLRPDAQSVLKRLSISPIPAGSGNALSANQLGPKEGRNTQLATIVALKGKPVPLDLCSFTQLHPDQASASTAGEPFQPRLIRRLSFLSVSFGLMAELDICHRFIFGAIANRKQRVRIDLRIIDDDKASIERNWVDKQRQIVKNTTTTVTTTASSSGEMISSSEVNHKDQEDASRNEAGDKSQSENGLPTLRFGDVSVPIQSNDGNDGWVTIEDKITTFYAGTLPFMATELLAFPAKVPGDGSIDLIIHKSPSTIKTLKMMDGAENGSMFKSNECRYYKTRAIRLTPISGTSKSDESSDSDKIFKKVTKIKLLNLIKNLIRSQKHKRVGLDDEGEEKGIKKSLIAVDGEEIDYRSIQVEVHSGMANVLSLNGRLGAVGLPERLKLNSNLE